MQISNYFGKQINVTITTKNNRCFGSCEEFLTDYVNSYNVIGFDHQNDVILEKIAPINKDTIINFTVDQLWFNQELTKRVIEIDSK